MPDARCRTTRSWTRSFFSLFGGVFGLLLWGRFRYDMVAFGALLLAVVLGLVPAEDAFAGFGHPAVVVVALGPRDLPGWCVRARFC
jgi:di/tricarboxylate transporter